MSSEKVILTKDKWEALAARCEAGESGRQLDADLAAASQYLPDEVSAYVRRVASEWRIKKDGLYVFQAEEPDVGLVRIAPPHFTASIDAAASLMPDGWWVEVTVYPSNTRAMAVTMPGNGTKTAVGSATTEALTRAALACRVRAHLAGKEGAA